MVSATGILVKVYRPDKFFGDGDHMIYYPNWNIF